MYWQLTDPVPRMFLGGPLDGEVLAIERTYKEMVHSFEDHFFYRLETWKFARSISLFIPRDEPKEAYTARARTIARTRPDLCERTT